MSTVTEPAPRTQAAPARTRAPLTRRLAFDRIGRRIRGIPLDTPLHPLPPAGERESPQP